MNPNKEIQLTKKKINKFEHNITKSYSHLSKNKNKNKKLLLKKYQHEKGPSGPK